jgi:hypothetical protein
MNTSDAVVVVTSPTKGAKEDAQLAETVAVELGLPFVLRRKRSIEVLRAQTGAAAVLVVSRERRTLRLDDTAPPLDFHCSTGVLRVRNLKHGMDDPLRRATEAKPGDTILDCTVGQCSDALLLAHVVAPTGKIVGLERSAAIYGLVSWGVTTHRTGEKAVDSALECIQVLRADYREYLRAQPSKSFDVVYFDPMFRTPTLSSGSFDTFRVVADYGPLTRGDIDEARRVARRRVVVKDHRSGEVLRELSLQRFGDVRGSTRVQYGFVDPL